MAAAESLCRRHFVPFRDSTPLRASGSLTSSSSPPSWRASSSLPSSLPSSWPFSSPCGMSPPYMLERRERPRVSWVCRDNPVARKVAFRDERLAAVRPGVPQHVEFNLTPPCLADTLRRKESIVNLTAARLVSYFGLPQKVGKCRGYIAESDDSHVI